MKLNDYEIWGQAAWENHILYAIVEYLGNSLEDQDPRDLIDLCRKFRWAWEDLELWARDQARHPLDK